MMYFGRNSGPNTLYYPSRCIVHQLFRSVITILEKLDLVRSLFALTNVLRIAGRQDPFRRALARVISTPGNLEYHAGVQPPPPDSPHRVHNSLLLDKLLVERAIQVEFGSAFSSDAQDELRRRADLLVELLQGPWHQATIHHYCVPGCACGGSREKLVSTLIELFIWLYCTLMPCSPTMSRWTTLGPALGSACVVTHGSFQRAWIVAFGKDPDAVAAAAGPDVDDAAVGFEPFSVTIGRRIRKAMV